MNMIIHCIICDNKLKGRQTLFCSARCKNKNHQCYDAQKARGIKRKIDLFKMAGSKCSICGYKKNLSALSFHHLFADKKDFKLDARSLSNRKMDKILKEFQGCKLVCHNCHAEIHNPDLDLGSLSLSRLL